MLQFLGNQQQTLRLDCGVGEIQRKCHQEGEVRDMSHHFFHNHIADPSILGQIQFYILDSGVGGAYFAKLLAEKAK